MLIPKTVRWLVKSERLVRISHVLNALEHPKEKGKGRTKPDWDSELTYVLEGGGEDIPVQIVCDVYAEDTTTIKDTRLNSKRRYQIATKQK
jgi:hypothetical protein